MQLLTARARSAGEFALKQVVSTILAVCLIAFSSCCAWSKSNDLNARIRFVEDGETFKDLRVPSYEWYPQSESPQALIVAVHGLTLNGKR
jgi:hypothetical protein